MVYEAVNEAVLSRVPENAQRILDLGCGSGALDKRLKEKIQCEIVGVTHSSDEAILASDWLDQILVCDLNNFEANKLGIFDCIVCSHVLEHLYHPDELIKHIRSNLSSTGVLIVALPNVLYWKQRLKFLKGHFKYTDGGLMDDTHYRFFDWQTARQLVEEAGYNVIYQGAEGIFPLPLIRSALGPLAKNIDKIAVSKHPGLFGAQFVIVAQNVY